MREVAADTEEGGSGLNSRDLQGGVGADDDGSVAVGCEQPPHLIAHEIEVDRTGSVGGGERCRGDEAGLGEVAVAHEHDGAAVESVGTDTESGRIGEGDRPPRVTATERGHHVVGAIERDGSCGGGDVERGGVDAGRLREVATNSEERGASLNSRDVERGGSAEDDRPDSVGCEQAPDLIAHEIEIDRTGRVCDRE